MVRRTQGSADQATSPVVFRVRQPRIDSLMWHLLSSRAQQRQTGYVLQIAVLTIFVLVVGVAAILARTSGGLIGASLQARNREARDTAESAIMEFVNTMNREPNRYVLVAGEHAPDTTKETWTDSTNPCTQYNDSGVEVSTTPTAVNSEAISRFTPGGYKNLIPTDSIREFKVVSVNYKQPTRKSYSRISDFKDNVINGGGGSLIEITVIGKVTRNGQISKARITREFEVVPKCCKASYASFGGNTWGRQTCSSNLPLSGAGTGIVASLNGGSVAGSNNNLDIMDENGKKVSKAICWAGNDSRQTSMLKGTPNSSCTSGNMGLGNNTASPPKGLEFIPLKFSLQLPGFADNNPYQASTARATLDISGGQAKSKYLYYKTGNQAGVRLCDYIPEKKPRLSSCEIPAYCFKDSDPTSESSPPRPKVTVNCRFESINVGSKTLYIDTSAAKFNFFFDCAADDGDTDHQGKNRNRGAEQRTDDCGNSSPTVSEYMALRGSGNYLRVDCSAASSGYDTSTYTGEAFCSNVPIWGTSKTGFQDKCSMFVDKVSVKCPAFDASELFNVYALGDKSFTLNGGAQSVGMNIFAPFASVFILGGGNANPNFMGRLWSNTLTLKGNVSIKTFSGVDKLPGGCATLSCPPSWIPRFDFVARSMTQSTLF